MLVPLRSSQRPSASGIDDLIETPGAATSGFRPSEIGVGPADEKSAIAPAFVVAATVIADGALPGEPTEPRPKSPNSLPADATTTTPTRVAPSIALTTRSRAGLISGPDREVDDVHAVAHRGLDRSSDLG